MNIKMTDSCSTCLPEENQIQNIKLKKNYQVWQEIGSNDPKPRKKLNNRRDLNDADNEVIRL